MDLSIQKLSKAFNQKTVFEALTFDIRSGSRFAITGSNGSGKSTLLKILSGGLLPTSGSISYVLSGQSIPEENVFRYIHFVAPYNTVIEELTLPELFQMHRKLGLLKAYDTYVKWKDRLQYPFRTDRQIKTFSSGMKQRVKLGLSILDDRPLILLDEPGSNLDAQGKGWLYDILKDLHPTQTLVIATNDKAEIELCNSGVSVEMG
jgi:ABC-type multidrug transport system ATPase subunit